METARLELRILGILIYVAIAGALVCCVISPYLLAYYRYEPVYIAPLCVIGLAFILAVWQLRGILRSVAEGEPFSRRNTARLTRISWMCFVVALASVSMIAIYFSFLKVLMVMLAVAGGLVMRVLARVFRLAALQKEEMDLII